MVEKIFLVDIDIKMTNCWKQLFANETNVLIINQDFGEFMKEHSEIDCIVSTGNSFGYMTGGLDAAYIAYFGKSLQDAVQKKIMEEHLGEQPVASSIVVDIPNFKNTRLVHTPSMRVPQPIIDPRVIYSCMRSSLVVAIRNGAKNIVLPAFGHLNGRVSAEIVSDLMYRAYKDVGYTYKNSIRTIRSFDEVMEIDDVFISHFICQ